MSLFRDGISSSKRPAEINTISLGSHTVYNLRQMMPKLRETWLAAV
jgi:hypothetical protein